MGRAEDLLARIDRAGEGAIDELILDRQSEELFLDFKRSSDNGRGTRLSDIDRDSLAKSISGFGNSEGGIVIWGVDCRPDQVVGDVATAKVKIENPRRFKSWLEGAVSGLTVPPHPGVSHIAIEDGGGAGFVASHIQKSYLAPHQCLRPPQYFMRAGSSFVPVPHGVLAGMFGRAPQPVVFHMWAVPPVEVRSDGTAWFRAELLLTNRSPTVARDTYLSITIDPPKGGSNISVEYADTQNWVPSHVLGCITQVIARDGYRLAPEVLVAPLRLVFSLKWPFEKDLFIKILAGCDGSSMHVHTHSVARHELQSLYNLLLENKESEESRRDFGRRIVGAS